MMIMISRASPRLILNIDDAFIGYTVQIYLLIILYITKELYIFTFLILHMKIFYIDTYKTNFYAISTYYTYNSLVVHLLVISTASLDCRVANVTFQ